MKDTGKILHNRFVLYFVLFLALSDLMFLAMGSEFISVAVFILSGFVTSFFSKNMMVIMCIAMVITNILRYGTGIRLMEGLKEGDAAKTTADAAAAETTTDAAAAKTTADAAAAETTADAVAVPAPAPVPVPVPAPAPAPVPVPAPAPVPAKKKVEKFTQEQMLIEKLESYKPLIDTMDRAMDSISKIINL